MADSSKNFTIRVLPTALLGGDGLWGTPIVCPIPCTQVVIENQDASNDQWVRSDPTDGGTQKTLPKSLELTLRANSSGDPVFQAGEVVCRVAPSVGAGPVCVTFLR